ncbi:MAG: PilZ domain-containing protein [Planctomycetes bacterium]|nr:PilZ domain-containing protein [Planctomycetota bacterium]
MNSPDIEYLIDQAVTSRPKVTNAPMNLYVCDGKVVCGARIVMPKNAALIAHLSPEHLKDGFNDRQWKLLVEKTKSILEKQHHNSDTTQREPIKDERRTESRLPYRRAVWFAEDLRKKLNRAVMCDVSSGGMSFTFCPDENPPQHGQQIATRFNVPKLRDNGSSTSVKFDRIGRICRIDKINNTLNRIAVQFTTPLPFVPTEQLNDQSCDFLNVLEDSAV